MKIAFVVAVLCLFAVCSASPSPSPIAKTQWHLRSPARGCVEVLHRFGGNEFRTYACDGAQGPCIFSPHVDNCPQSALFHKPSFERVVNVRSRDHLVRYYNQIGGACVLTLLPKCCASKQFEEVIVASGCRCIKLPTGETICDPYRCGHGTQENNAAVMDDKDEEMIARRYLNRVLQQSNIQGGYVEQQQG